MTATTTALVPLQPAFSDAERLALAGFLAGYRGLTREAYALDLRQFTGWCRIRSLSLSAVRRADIEAFARDLEARGRARSTVTRRLCTIAGFYKYAVEEELLEHSPAAHVRRPRVDYKSHAVALDRNELGALLVAAGLGTPIEHALISLLALNGLRVSEATGADIEHLGLERGHRTLTITRKGSKVVTVPLAPRTHWLQSVGYPAVRTVDVDQPVMIARQAITFWEAISDDGDQYASTAEVAGVLLELHKLTAPADLHLPDLAPFASAPARIATNTWLTPVDRSFLTAMLAQMQDAYAGLEFVLPPGPIHGDVNVGNVLRDRNGRSVVIDLDGLAVGPREWDLALTAIYFDSFGWHTRAEYEDFVRVYGFDIMSWPGYPVMRAVREFMMVTWVIQKAPESAPAAEAVKRPRHEACLAELRPRILGGRPG